MNTEMLFEVCASELESLKEFFPGEDLLFKLTGVAAEDKPLTNTIILAKRKIPEQAFLKEMECIIVARDSITLCVKGKSKCRSLKADTFKSVYSNIVNECVAKASKTPTKHISSKSLIGANTYIGNNVQIGHCVVVGANCIIKDNVAIGNNVVIEDNCVIGSNDADCYISAQGQRMTVPHIAGVSIEDGCLILSGATIAAGVGKATQIGKRALVGTKAIIAHNTVIGDDCLINAGATVCGYCSIGDCVYIGAGAIIKNRVTIENNSFVGIGSVVTRRVRQGDKVFGNPARKLEWEEA